MYGCHFKNEANDKVHDKAAAQIDKEHYKFVLTRDKKTPRKQTLKTACVTFHPRSINKVVRKA